MHSVDPTTESMIRSVLAYAENRLRLDPVPLDQGSRDPAELDAALAGLPGAGPHTPDQVLGVYASMLAPAEPELGVVLFRRRGWEAGQYTAWADWLLADQVAFIPPSAWEGETVARFAFLHPHTTMDLVRQILDRMD